MRAEQIVPSLRADGGLAETLSIYFMFFIAFHECNVANQLILLKLRIHNWIFNSAFQVALFTYININFILFSILSDND